MMDQDKECFLSPLRLHGGHIWFTWLRVKPEDLQLRLTKPLF
jgi:hypothetical protein